jgi:hypothetical protein
MAQTIQPLGLSPRTFTTRSLGGEIGRSGRTRTCKAMWRWFPKPEGFHLPAYTSIEKLARLAGIEPALLP